MNPVGGGGGASVQQVIAMRDAMLEKSRLLKELQQGQQAQSTVPTDAPAQGGGFGDSLKDALSSVNDAQQRSSAASEAYARGETQDVAKVMLARQEAGVAFEATLQVRNKLLSAYQEIMRMGV
ncbi:flagellar hook-basal body complex protein FliE [Aurantiacibacter flavus]